MKKAPTILLMVTLMTGFCVGVPQSTERNTIKNTGSVPMVYSSIDFGKVFKLPLKKVTNKEESKQLVYNLDDLEIPFAKAICIYTEMCATYAAKFPNIFIEGENIIFEVLRCCE